MLLSGSRSRLLAATRASASCRPNAGISDKSTVIWRSIIGVVVNRRMENSRCPWDFSARYAVARVSVELPADSSNGSTRPAGDIPLRPNTGPPHQFRIDRAVPSRRRNARALESPSTAGPISRGEPCEWVATREREIYWRPRRWRNPAGKVVCDHHQSCWRPPRSPHHQPSRTA
jgi:hypothetical protein